MKHGMKSGKGSGIKKMMMQDAGEMMPAPMPAKKGAAMPKAKAVKKATAMKKKMK